MIEELLLDIDNKEVFDFESTFALYKRVSEIIIENEVVAQRLIVNVLDNKDKFDQSLNIVLTDLIEAVGFYPYI